ncbi:MAG: hypothetical protein M3R24_33295 [Chloroflexota bacterium]|nr:hypothetical protein [Chloroflexota bacterium]
MVTLGHSSTAVTEQVSAFVSQEQVTEGWRAAAAQHRERGRGRAVSVPDPGEVGEKNDYR